MWNRASDLPASVYSCSTYYSSNEEPDFTSPSICLLKNDIDRSLRTFDTNFDPSCLDELEDQLLDHPLESFAAMCYKKAVARRSMNDSDRCMFDKSPTPVHWQEDEDTLDSDEASSLRFASVGQCTKPEESLLVSTNPFKHVKSQISVNITIPFLLNDPALAMVVPKPHESIQYSPTSTKKLSRKDTLSKVFGRIKSFPRRFVP